MTKITDSQHKALRWLYNAGDDGLITRGGVILCKGQRGRFLPETWLRLMTLGMIDAGGPLRIKISGDGKSYCEKQFGLPDLMKTDWTDDACELD